MAAKPICLDLFCGAGGFALGMKQAGMFVVGVDIKRPKKYHGDIFIQADIRALPFTDLMWADLIVASPPCQLFSPATALSLRNKKKYPNFIPLTRKLLFGHPWTCIENVPQAPIRPNLILVGPQFGLGPDGDEDGLWRRRYFELSFFAWQLNIPKMPKGRCVSIAGTFSAKHHFNRRKAQGKPGSVPTHEAKKLMGIPQHIKMTRKEIGQSVPPPYARYIGLEVQARWRESGYVPILERKSRARAGKALQEARKLQEIPF